jgi:hypothetical protein
MRNGTRSQKRVATAPGRTTVIFQRGCSLASTCAKVSSPAFAVAYALKPGSTSFSLSAPM